MTQAEKFADQKIKEIAKQKVVFDIGGCRRFQKGLAKYKEYFNGCCFRTVDVNRQCQPDILADAQNLPIASETADGVLCRALFEYVENPQKAASEVYRILKPGGKCFASMVFLHSYHGKKTKKDYWRFSQDGIQYLFRQFSRIEICSLCGNLETTALLLPFSKKMPVKIIVYFARFLDILFKNYQSHQQSRGFHVFLVK